MRPSAVLLLLFLFCQVLSSESKLRQQTINEEEDEDEDEDEEEDWDESNDSNIKAGRPLSKSEIDDDGRIYKNPRNSPSADCPRNAEEAKLHGQKCLRKCSTDEDCKSKKKKCRCDGSCGMSCIKPDRECSSLESIDSGGMRISGNFFGDRAHYTCHSDYYLVGLSERICRADGQWSGNPPSCKKEPGTFCSQPPKMKNAHHDALPEQTTFDVASTVQYYCVHGYVTKGVNKARCLSTDGITNWFGPDITCEPQNCGAPANIPSGWHSGQCYTYDCEVSYHCREGYELVGRSEKMCLADGTWTPVELPQCVQVTSVVCPRPENPTNGKAVYTSHAYNSIVSYECKYGYTVVGEPTRQCGADRKWSGKEPVCSEINCGSPGVLYNGWIEGIESGTGLGASLIYRCGDHMKLEGNSSSVCQVDGKWRYPVPLCLAPCVVPHIENGHIIVASHDQDHINNVTVVEHGEQLLVTCVQDYEFAANSTPVVCNNGTWSIVPSCTPARCKQMPKPPKNGMVIAPKMEHGMKALFQCKDGFDRIGGGPMNDSISVVCRYGQWIGDIPHCIQVFCAYPGLIVNGKVYLVGNMGVYDYRPYVKKIANNKQIMYDCEKGYVLDEGPPGATCIGGHWYPKELPKCILGQHPRLRWSRRRRSISGNLSADITESYKKLIEFFRKIGKKLLHLDAKKEHIHSRRKTNANETSNAIVIGKNHENTTDVSKLTKENRTRIRDEKMMDFLKSIYQNLELIDSRQSNNNNISNNKNNNNNTKILVSMHDLLNAMSKNFFHIDLSKEVKKSSSNNTDPRVEGKIQKEFTKLKKEFDKIVRFYEKSMHWKMKWPRDKNPNTNRQKTDIESKGTGKKRTAHHEDKENKSKERRTRRKNYYKGFYEFINNYIKQKLDIGNRDEPHSRNGTALNVNKMYEFVQHIIENELNSNTRNATIIRKTEPTQIVTISSNELPSYKSNDTSQIISRESLKIENVPKHRSKRIRNTQEETTRHTIHVNTTSPRPIIRKLLTVLKERRTTSSEDKSISRFIFNELKAHQQSRSKRYLPHQELDNQIFLKNLYLHAYEDEYRTNVRRSMNNTESKFKQI